MQLGTIRRAKFGKDAFEMTIGNSEIKGKLEKLSKPLVFTERKETSEGGMEFNIKGVIRNKIVFNTRPTPLRFGKKLKVWSNANDVSERP